MSDRALKSEIEILVKESGYKKSSNLLCPIIKIVSMRHQDLSSQQIYKVAKSIF